MIAVIQHVSFEPPALIGDWLVENNLQHRLVKIYNHEPLPDHHQIDGLIVMGGPMNVYEENQYSWLKAEKDLVLKMIESGKKVLGVCLGSQLVSSALGFKVKRNSALEIGWFSVKIDSSALPTKYSSIFPDDFTSFHWHGDTFEIPDGAIHFASSEGCTNQGYLLNDNVMALQFHMEMTEKSVEELFENCAEDLLSESVFVQSAETIRNGVKYIDGNKRALFKLLSTFFLD